jgi:hypothetical protein
VGAPYVIQGNNVMPGTAQVKAKSDDWETTLAGEATVFIIDMLQ